MSDLSNSHQMKWIIGLVERYPLLFRIIEDDLFFSDDLSIIFDEPLHIIYSGLYLQIVPKNGNFKVSDYWFCIEISSDYDPDYDKFIALNKEFTLPDALCMKFYKSGFDVDGYDRVLIERRHTISNIINS